MMRARRLLTTGIAALGVLALNVGVAQALVPLPTASTEGASEVTYDSATLSGAVVPGGVGAGSETRWCFEYGTGPSGEYNLGSLPLLAGDAGQGTSPVPVSVSLSDLQPGSTYRYRLVAVNALGMGLGSTACGTEGGQEADGAEALFTTPTTLPPPLAVTGAASGVSQNAATISGTVDPLGVRTSYEFQLGVDTSYGAEVFGEAGAGSEARAFSLALVTLQPDTTYHYRVVAIGQGGTTYGADATFTTGGYPSAALSAPPTTPLIATPVFAFPAEASAVTVAPPKKALTNAEKLANALKACKKEPKRKQAACEQRARKKYTAVKRKGKK